MSVHLTLTTFQKAMFVTLIKNAKIPLVKTETGAEITQENFEPILDCVHSALYKLSSFAQDLPDTQVEVRTLQQISDQLDKLWVFFPNLNKEVIKGEVGNEVLPEWVVPDEAPELTQEFFEKAEISIGEKVIRPRRKRKTSE